MVTKTEKILKTEIKHTHYCDVCGKQSHDDCQRCGKDICREHRVEDPKDWNSDHPRHFCEDCWEIGKPFLEECRKLTEKYDVEVDAIVERWEEACVKNRGDA